MEQQAPKNILESIDLVNRLTINSNENEMNIFLHLAAISVTESWKNPAFYEGAPKLRKYMDKKFTALMKEIFYKTTTWFRNMESILNLPDGKNLLLRHGRSNMVAYLAFAETERELVLKMAKVNPIADFHALLRSAGLRGQQNPDNDENKKDIWKKKYLAEVRKNKKLQKKCDKQEQTIAELKATIRGMMSVRPDEKSDEQHAH